MDNQPAINWNTMTPEGYRLLEAKLQNKNKTIRQNVSKNSKKSGKKKVIKIGNDAYLVDENTVSRLKTIKSEKAKEKIIKEIIAGGSIKEI